jgi:transposase-like protein
MQSIVTGPLGTPITLDDLPLSNTIRWVARRKAEIVAAVEGGLMSTHSACALYDLSLDELLSWRRTLARQGLSALRLCSLSERRRSAAHVRRYRRAGA